MQLIRGLSHLLPLCLALCLASCGNAQRKAALSYYVKQVKSRAISEIEPLPEVKPYETFTYEDADLRSPFVPSTPVEVARKSINDSGIHPDTNRRKEPLEKYPLDTLRMVGTLEGDGQKWALILDKDGVIHRVTKGNYLGQNDGKIELITEEKVSLIEIIANPSGGWQEKKAMMSLKQDDGQPRANPAKNIN